MSGLAGLPRQGLAEAQLPGIPLFRRGKVRDTFDLGDRLLMVATDRLSAFDCVLPDLVPGRGVLLTSIARHWFRETSEIVPNHLLPDDPSDILPSAYRELAGRSMLVARAKRLDVECVVRGRLAGSAWKEYRERGTVAGEALPSGLGFGAPLDPARFTPATKNDQGHDQNLTRDQLADSIGAELAGDLERTSLRLFRLGEARYRELGFVVADTKFEFGLLKGRLTLIDEILTPDSSRIWELGEDGVVARPQGYDKQPVRDYLEASSWDRRPPGPRLPPELLAEVGRRYQEVWRRISEGWKSGKTGADS